MRILVLSQYFWPEIFRVNDLVQGLVERGHDVTILTGVPNYPEGKVFDAYRSDPKAFSKFFGAEVKRVPMLPRGSNSITLFLNFVIFAISASLFGPWLLRGRGFDAIFVFEPSPISIGVPAAVLRAIKRVPVVFWVLDLWPESLSATGMVRSKFILGAVSRLVRFVYDHCDLILAQSRSFIPEIRKFEQAEEKVIYFPSWAERQSKDGPIRPAPEVSETSENFTIVFTGNIGEAQDFPAILDAAEKLQHNKDIRWIIVGDGRRASWLRTEIQRRNLQEQILMPGRFPLERMPSFYAHADALLVPLKAEPIFALTLPGKLQTYLAEGKPILAMLDGEGAETVRRSGCGIAVAAGSSQELADAVLKMAALSPAQRAKMGEMGLRLSQTEFDRDAQIDTLVRLIRNVIDTKSQL